ncbi:MAG: hypothetical protein V2I57_02690 [Xanthomonadales bacterium]|jgi:hypothetical protein|nr:hypothetical protein [Xanthomonadales bacterium]
MALDDLMDCIAKGVKLAFFALMLGVLAVGLARPWLAVEPDRPEEAASVGTADRIEPDQSVVEYFLWSAPIWCALVDHVDPIVRLMASKQIAARAVMPEVYSINQSDIPRCERYPDRDSLEAVRFELLDQIKDDPAILARIYITDCHQQRKPSKCNYPEMQRRLIEQDPNNAFVHLLPLLEEVSPQDEAKPLSDGDMHRLQQAASASRYESYTNFGMFDLYRAFSETTESADPLIFSEEARQELINERYAESTVQRSDLDWALIYATFDLFAVLVAEPMGYTGLLKICESDEIQKQPTAKAHCIQIANLMTSTATSEMDRMIGRALARRLVEPSNAIREADDMQDNWSRVSSHVLHACQFPRGLPGEEGRLPELMPLDHLEQYLEDFQELGEPEAVIRAADREYTRYPRAFALPPRRCEEINRLPESARQALAAQWDTAMRNGWSPAAQDQLVRSAAQQLELFRSNGSD